MKTRPMVNISSPSGVRTNESEINVSSGDYSVKSGEIHLSIMPSNYDLPSCGS